MTTGEMNNVKASNAVAMLIKLRIHEGQEEEFRREMNDVLGRVRQEPACLSIAGHQDPDDPQSFMLFEVWESREAFAEFETGREYLKDYMERVTPMWSAPRDLTVWNHVA